MLGFSSHFLDRKLKFALDSALLSELQPQNAFRTLLPLIGPCHSEGRALLHKGGQRLPPEIGCNY